MQCLRSFLCWREVVSAKIICTLLPLTKAIPSTLEVDVEYNPVAALCTANMSREQKSIVSTILEDRRVSEEDVALLDLPC